MKKLIYGVGINDSDYTTEVKAYYICQKSGKKLRKLVWICPFFLKWKGMLERCYSEIYQQKRPTYIGCYTIPEWHYFMNFRAWMETQDWQGKQLDKDILVEGNKLYGPDTCVFVDQKVNTFILENTSRRGEYPIGVHYDKNSKKYKAQCHNAITGEREYLGLYTDVNQAHLAWLTFKTNQASLLADEQTDVRVATALLNKYKNYQTLDNQQNLA